MEEAGRAYARRILVIHLLLLAAVAGFVLFAATEVYSRAKQQLLAQAKDRQEVLAEQTARGIESYYESIIADLNFLKRTEESPDRGERPAGERPVIGQLGQAAAPRLLRPLANQLEGRASHLIFLQRAGMNVVRSFPEEDTRTGKQIVKGFENWLKDVKEPALSRYRPAVGSGTNLVAVPVGSNYILAAVVPAANVEKHFLSMVNRNTGIIATLVDHTGMVMATSDFSLDGAVATTAPTTVEMARPPRKLDMTFLEVGTHEYDRVAKVGKTSLPARLTTVKPVYVGGQTFDVVISSRLSDVTGAVNSMFSRALIGAIFVVLCVSGILVSTAIRLIRGRARLESVRHEMLTREINQARRIQLNWLPDHRASQLSSARIAAVNQPASHISGDFYDWFDLADGRSVVTIGDVTGHGMAAAFLMSTTQILVRTSMSRLGDAAKCLEDINNQLCNQKFHGQFVTMVILVLDAKGNTLEVATAGHLPPLVNSGRGFKALAMEPQMVLGVDCEERYRSQRFAFPAGSEFVLYTDGVIDAQRMDGKRFGAERIIGALGAEGGLSPQEMVDRLVMEVAEFRGGRALADDLTLVAVQSIAAAKAAGAQAMVRAMR